MWFLILCIALMVAALGGILGRITESVGAVMLGMPSGDFATWFSGIATTAVAFLAYKTSRNAAKIAHEAHEANLKAEALKVDYFMEMEWYGMHEANEDMAELEPDALELPLRPGQPWEDDYYDPYARVIVRITNRNDHALSPARLLMRENLTGMNEPAQPREFPKIRPGDTRFWFKVFIMGHSSAGLVWALNNNKLVEWLEFTDSHGVCWRRLSDGSLQRQDQRIERAP